ncbi:LCP family protein [Cytobacillus suaedae]|nr:LCP family protein [Cytobacillus suaedae]
MKNRKIKRALLFMGVVVTFFIIGISVYSYSVYHTAEDTVEIMYEEKKVSKKRVQKVEVEELSPISIALFGVDERKYDTGRSDTIIILTVNPNTETTYMVSIPRDTRTEIAGKSIEDKINHAYAFGGTDMAIETVENFLDIPIDYFIKVNMDGFKEAVDAIGGVKIQNELSFKNGGYTFNEGELNLDGPKALAFSRMRKNDPLNDFGRQERQKALIKAMIQKGTSISSLTRFDDLFQVLGKNVKTNLTFSEILEIQKQYRDAGKNIEQLEVKGKDQYIDGIYYYRVNEEEKKTLTQKLRSHLELEKDEVNILNESEPAPLGGD